MPTVAPEEIERIGTGILRAAGASDEEARIIMEHLVGANLAGHDSHGIILLPTYIARINHTHIVPGRRHGGGARDPQQRAHQRQLGLRIRRHHPRHGNGHRQGPRTPGVGHHHLPAEPRRAPGGLPADGGARRHDRPDHLRTPGAAPRPWLRSAGARRAPRHQPAVGRLPQRPRRAGLSGHGDQRGGWRQAGRAAQPRRGRATRLGDRQTRRAHHRPRRLLRRRRHPAHGRRPGAQGLCAVVHGRDPVRPSHRPRFSASTRRAGTTTAPSWPSSTSRRSARSPSSSATSPTSSRT